MVAGQRSVIEKERLESFKVFGIGKEDDKKIIQRLGFTHYSSSSTYLKVVYNPFYTYHHFLLFSGSVLREEFSFFFGEQGHY